VRIEYNLFENNWQAAQQGYSNPSSRREIRTAVVHGA